MKLEKYLFCYFTGNAPEEERVHFALSHDGYNFVALNNNEPVIKQTLGKKCCRDPFIFRDKNNFFHISILYRVAYILLGTSTWNKCLFSGSKRPSSLFNSLA